jgi:hypothetical protein
VREAERHFRKQLELAQQLVATDGVRIEYPLAGLLLLVVAAGDQQELSGFGLYSYTWWRKPVECPLVACCMQEAMSVHLLHQEEVGN